MNSNEAVLLISGIQRAMTDARNAYHAYASVVEWKAHNGEPMPPFENLTIRQQLAWMVAVTVKGGEKE